MVTLNLASVRLTLPCSLSVCTTGACCGYIELDHLASVRYRTIWDCLQLPRARIVHTSIIVSTDGYDDDDVAAVRTEWPVGLNWRDFGAEATDDVDGRLQV